ncbi:type II secretion system F family protein [uncultured Microbacterium sp.]|uniref:type II secretion system F family protein n=1 Tax=uncultured Microbacterium sp. TaxID=191216 RepID=UPI0025CC7154|nr:type II secretion system F family protein [uncultured Microbacterium sp.]
MNGLGRIMRAWRMRGGREERVDAGAHAADAAHRLAVLLEAGLAPTAAWRHLDGFGGSSGGRAGDVRGIDTRGIVRELSLGRSAGAAIAALGPHWRELGAAWDVASLAGAPLAPALRSAAEALREATLVRDEVAVALAEPAATGRLMTLLPFIGVLLGAALGFDAIGVLFTTPPGWLLLFAGGALIVAARVWNARLVARATPRAGIAGFGCELVALALAGGVSIDRARALAAAGLEGSGGGADDGLDATDDALALSRAAGVPAVGLLRAAGAEARRRARVDGRLRASRLGSALLLPLGVCVLPAFLALGVAPIVLAVLSSAQLPGLVGAGP